MPHPIVIIISAESSIAHGVPLEERLRLPCSTPVSLPVQDFSAPAEPPVPDQPAHDLPLREGHIPIPDDEIDSRLHGFDILQKPYSGGLRKDEAPAKHISYCPSGFTVATVLAGDLSEISGADDPLPTSEGRTWPEKIAFYFEFYNDDYNKPVQMKQRRVPATKGGFAKLAAEEVRNMRTHLPQFPYALEQIKVVSIEVCSRGTVQARLFLSADGDAAPAQDQAAV
uniref:Uncharacterized protein n=1 Tax=Ganoderma boninense TaxID=34458 RepID=A0A5K1JX68_9APHY|nr:Uncharacterized protein [Ganoderma boninense]